MPACGSSYTPPCACLALLSHVEMNSFMRAWSGRTYPRGSPCPSGLAYGAGASRDPKNAPKCDCSHTTCFEHFTNQCSGHSPMRSKRPLNGAAYPGNRFDSTGTGLASRPAPSLEPNIAIPRSPSDANARSAVIDAARGDAANAATPAAIAPAANVPTTTARAVFIPRALVDASAPPFDSRARLSRRPRASRASSADASLSPRRVFNAISTSSSPRSSAVRSVRAIARRRSRVDRVRASLESAPGVERDARARSRGDLYRRRGRWVLRHLRAARGRRARHTATRARASVDARRCRARTPRRG